MPVSFPTTRCRLQGMTAPYAAKVSVGVGDRALVVGTGESLKA